MSTEAFFNSDHSSTLFPLSTSRLMVERHNQELSDYIYQKVLNDSEPSDSFLSQQRVYSTKPNGHLRRTFKLDPVAEFYIYDVVYRNRQIFRTQVSDARRSFGYRFSSGSSIAVHAAYREYKEALQECSDNYSHSLSFDIASYFNSIYHHDLVHWFCSKTQSADDGQSFGKFLREINVGRSVDVLPQGLYPCKMLGNEFLKLVDVSGNLKSAKLVRFMDDFTLYDSSAVTLRRDFQKIQQILGQYGLNINPSKTRYDARIGDVSGKLNEIKEALSEIIEDFEPIYGASTVDVVVNEIEIENPLDADQVRALIDLLKNDEADESDADMILGFLSNHAESEHLLEVIPELLSRFPNLIKHIYSVCANVEDKQSLRNVISQYLAEDDSYLEYQLFWLVKIVEDHILDHVDSGDLLNRLYELTGDHKIARAKILEIPVQNYGFKELRLDYLKTGQSDWLSWAAAMGSRTLIASERNHLLTYFSKGSPLNFLVAECVKKF
ncbi:TPA: hypothetical protein QEL11_002797 [Stenotrophomonas maltophilia]|nr:hypothetical protein [Stenotrophomonas maltophilia]